LGVARAVVDHGQSPERAPIVIWSCTKSTDQRRFGPDGTGIGDRAPNARLRPPRRRTISRS
jgi:hypothetical protein